MNVLRRLTLALTLCFFFGAAYAQYDVGKPVKWKASLEELSDGVFEVQVAASIKEGWHSYGLGPYDGGPNPTILTVSGSGVELVGEPYVKQGGKRVFDDVFGMEIDLLEDGDVLAQKIKVGPGAKKIDVTVEWQACTAGSCAPLSGSVPNANIKEASSLRRFAALSSASIAFTSARDGNSSVI